MESWSLHRHTQESLWVTHILSARTCRQTALALTIVFPFCNARDTRSPVASECEHRVQKTEGRPLNCILLLKLLKRISSGSKKTVS
jgi:hypothetical protein